MTGLAKWITVVLFVAMLMGSKCEINTRNNVEAGFFDYVKSGTSSILNNLFPVKNMFAPAT